MDCWKRIIGLSGRRHDMIVKYLAWSDGMHSFAHFDEPCHELSVVRLVSEPDVRLLGLMPYGTIRLIQHSDVALISHLVNDMTRSMNPSKEFAHCSKGETAVSSPAADPGSRRDHAAGADAP